MQSYGLALHTKRDREALIVKMNTTLLMTLTKMEILMMQMWAETVQMMNFQQCLHDEQEQGT